MSTPNANDFLMGSGAKSATFPQIGATITGRIVRTPEVRQQTTPEGAPKTFDNGDPMLQLVVQLQTDERDPQDLEDDGIRGLYIKSNMLNAVRDAVRRSGAKGLDVGGTLTVQYTSDGEVKRKGFNPPKIYAARYVPPTAQAANDFLNAGNGTQQQNPTAPAPQNSFAPQPTGLENVPPTPPAGAAPAGIDPEVWKQLNPNQRASVLAATNNVRS
jgi:hypothetical protein